MTVLTHNSMMVSTREDVYEKKSEPEVVQMHAPKLTS